MALSGIFSQENGRAGFLFGPAPGKIYRSHAKFFFLDR